MSLNTPEESDLNTHDTCHGRTQPSVNNNEDDDDAGTNVYMSLTVYWSALFVHDAKHFTYTHSVHYSQ